MLQSIIKSGMRFFSDSTAKKSALALAVGPTDDASYREATDESNMIVSRCLHLSNLNMHKNAASQKAWAWKFYQRETCKSAPIRGGLRRTESEPFSQQS